MLRTSGLRRLARLPPRTRTSIRQNSSYSDGHHDAHTHASFPPPVQGDGTAPLMTPGIRTTFFLFVGAFALYSYETYLIKKNGRGIIHGWLTDKVEEGWGVDEYLARIEGARQRTKEHYELSQRPIVRSNYPEGANMANPYGLTAADKPVKTKEARSSWE